MTQQEQLEAKVANIVTKLYANAHGLPTKDLPSNVGLMTPSIEVAETISAITALIQEAVNEGGAAKFIEHGWGKRCKTSDLVDFPESEGDPLTNRCPCCEMWEHYDEWLATLKLNSGDK